MTPRTALALFILTSLTLPARADDWPQWLGPQRDGVWRETGLIDKFAAKPVYRWRTPIGAGYSGPAVANGRVFITDRVLAKGAKNDDNAFARTPVEGVERILCLKESDGSILWKKEYPCGYSISYPAGPRTTPLVVGDKVYTLGAMGDLHCLDVNKGDILWSKNLPKEYKAVVAQWGFAGHPLAAGNAIIVPAGGKDSVLVALDKDTGKELWTNLSAGEPGYGPPMLYDIAGQKQVVYWSPDALSGLDPEGGKLLWSLPIRGQGGKKGGGGIRVGMTNATPRLQGDRIFLTSFYEGAAMVQVKDGKNPELLWRSKGRSEQPDETESLHSIIPTPFWKGGHIYGVCSYGELRCIDATNGERKWSTHAATTGKSVRWGNAFLVPIGEKAERFILFNELGDLILARLTPERYDEISRVNILEPTNTMAKQPKGRRVIWSHPAFANRCVFARNDREIVCVSLDAKDAP